MRTRDQCEPDTQDRAERSSSLHEQEEGQGMLSEQVMMNVDAAAMSRSSTSHLGQDRRCTPFCNRWTNGSKRRAQAHAMRLQCSRVPLW
jgi:hypothetical protein